MSQQTPRPTGPFAPQYIHGVYIPAGLIVFGVFILKQEWLPYAVVVAAILGAWKIYNNRELLPYFKLPVV
jgi:cytochrome-b5 reductase